MFEYRAGPETFFSSSKELDRREGPPSLVFNDQRGSILGVRRPGREVDHSPPPSAEVQNEWSYTSILIPTEAFTAWTATNLF